MGFLELYVLYELYLRAEGSDIFKSFCQAGINNSKHLTRF